ncbi:MAG: hypothetical protein Q8N44_21500 [Rubrivivax sp.]|nr:hypothetical protein [Rubrivivax sp.]MDP3086253.1 hypothetical protein [Rubrivivax sp.]
MKALHWGALLSACPLILGCASTVNPPLLFGDHTTYGLHLGSEPASTGGSVVLGYKARSLAVVPVSVLQPDGSAAAIRSKDGDPNAARDTDALSVFAVFENQAEESGDTKSAVRLGQIFATGLAAQSLTRGIRCRADPADDACKKAPAPAVSAAQKVTASTALTAENVDSVLDTALRRVLAEVGGGKVAAGAAPATEAPYQSPLVFVRTDTIGINIGGSIVEQGMRFAIGADFNNVALIPPATRNGQGRHSDLYAIDAEGKRTDVLSVLGQFESTTATKGLNLGLKRYFATGLAARNLAQALGAEIAKQPPPDPATPVK